MGLRDEAIAAYQQKVAADEAEREEREAKERRAKESSLVWALKGGLGNVDYQIEWAPYYGEGEPHALVDGIRFRVQKLDPYNNVLTAIEKCPDCDGWIRSWFIDSQCDLGAFLVGEGRQHHECREDED